MMVRWNFCSMIRSLVRSFSCEEQSLQRVQQESHVLVITSLLPDNLLVVSVFPPDIIHSRLTEKGIQGNRGTCTCHEIQVLSGQGAHNSTGRLLGNTRAQTLWPPRHHIPLTIREASSSSSFLACWTPCGSPSILIRLLFSLSGGMRTDTL